MDALGVGNVADDSAGGNIENLDLSGAGDEEAARVAVKAEVVPAIGAGEGNLADDVVAEAAGLRLGQRADGAGKKRGRREDSEEQWNCRAPRGGVTELPGITHRRFL